MRREHQANHEHDETPGHSENPGRRGIHWHPGHREPGVPMAVSYTHLTLPTICSV